MKVKTCELEGVVLDYAVALVQGWRLDPDRPVDEGQIVIEGKISLLQWLRFSTDWYHGGPLIEEHGIGLWYPARPHFGRWAADSEKLLRKYAGTKSPVYASNPLEAVCRAVVLANLGDEVEVPDGLTAVRGGGP